MSTPGGTPARTPQSAGSQRGRAAAAQQRGSSEASMAQQQQQQPDAARTPSSSPQAGLGSVPATPRTPSDQPQRAPRAELRGSGRKFEMKPAAATTESGMPATPLDGQVDGSTAVRAEVWGTTVTVDAAKAAFHQFFLEFKLEAHADPLYPALLRESLDSSQWNLNLNLHNLAQFNMELYKQLVVYPQEIIPICDQVLDLERKLIENPDDDPEVAAELDNRPILQTRPFNLLAKKNMRELNPEDMDTLVSIKGMVIRVGSIIPDMQRAYFACTLCEQTVQVPIEEGWINEPVQCANCSSRYTYDMIHNRCKFADKQCIKIQETPDSIPEGETPHAIKVFAFDDLVDVVKPGDRVEITGIYKASASKVNARRSQLSTVYKTYVDAIHFKKTDNQRMANEVGAASSTASQQDAAGQKHNPNLFDEHDATKADTDALEAKIRALAEDPHIYDRLTASLAPSIWEMDDVKKGILCLLFGGAGAEEGASSGKFRGEINVLMCGDPGTSKSQLLQYVHKIAPRGIYTSGKGSSAVGLTASVVRDAESREMVLESGALVLSDRGVCCIDEFDKMSDATRSILHEVMEQQTVSIAKAGIVCTLNARTSILASANPKESRYNPKLSVVENVQIMPTLLSRFDLIYLVLDQPDTNKDRKLAKHLVSLYYENVERAAHDVIPMDLLTSYISYARRTVRPALTDEAIEYLCKSYVDMRGEGRKGGQRVISATPRQLEALIRLSEALAKMELSPKATLQHAHEALRLMQVATQNAAMDKTTGRIDMDALQTGHSANDRAQEMHLADALQELIAKAPSNKLSSSKLFSEFNSALQAGQQHINKARFDEVLQALAQADFILFDKHKGTITRR